MPINLQSGCYISIFIDLRRKISPGELIPIYTIIRSYVWVYLIIEKGDVETDLDIANAAMHAKSLIK